MSDVCVIPDRIIIAVTGEDATTFLQGLVTNGPPTQGGCLSALLTPQGKILFEFTLIKSDDGYVLAAHSDASEALIKRLKLYRLRAKVGIEASPKLKLLSDNRIAEAEFNAELNSSYHERRIHAGVPQWGSDFGSNEVFPMDVNFDLLNGIDYKKGCFVGQEVASRMKRKGDARKRTLIAKFDGEAPEKGAAVTAGDSTLGTIMSGVDGAALALIRLDRWSAARDDGREILAGIRPITLTTPTYMDSE
ncbi:MAG: folate-binding protein YgfZ [Marinicaulis sp.]|nr:folate-binding protein YgfZ [Marinicaulis sp.]